MLKNVQTQVSTALLENNVQKPLVVLNVHVPTCPFTGKTAQEVSLVYSSFTGYYPFHE